MGKNTSNPKCNGLRSFISFARVVWPSPSVSVQGDTSKISMSKSLGSNGSWSKAKNPGFSTAQTYQEAIDLTVHIQVSAILVKQNKSSKIA